MIKTQKDWDTKYSKFQKYLSSLSKEKSFYSTRSSKTIQSLLVEQKKWVDLLQSQFSKLAEAETVQWKNSPKEEAFFFWVQSYTKKMKDVFFQCPDVLSYLFWGRLLYKKFFGRFPSVAPSYEELLSEFHKLSDEKKILLQSLERLQTDISQFDDIKDLNCVSKANQDAMISPLEVPCVWENVVQEIKGDVQ